MDVQLSSDSILILRDNGLVSYNMLQTDDDE